MIWDEKRDDLFEFYRNLIELRKREEALGAGDFRVISAKIERDST